jgi:thiol-disulfide isomerase/thioredoxin
MKNISLAMLLLLLLLPLFSFDSDSLVGHPMPLLPGKTLDGKIIDAGYYKNHVTVVSFMAIGCMPCMNEISTLNKIQDEYAARGVQVLCIARQMGDQMIKFNSDDKKSYFYLVRNALKAEPIKYTILPACANGKSKMLETTDSAGDVISVNLKVECNTLEEKYGVTAIPATFFVDKKGIIRKTEVGGPGEPNDTAFYERMKKEIDYLRAK